MWNVVFATAIGDKTVDRFDCSISQLSRYIGKPGTISATIPIPNQGIGDRCQAIAGRAGQLTAYVYYGSDIWWGGTVDTSPLKGGRHGPSLEITGSTFDAYLGRREVRTDTVWSQVEQVETIRTAWNSVQATADGNLGISVPAVPASGVLRDLTVLRSQARKWADVIKEVSNRADGYEWLVDVYDDGTGARFRELKVGYPQIGRAKFDQVFSYPGSIIDYTYDRDSLAGATSFQASGDAVGPAYNGQAQPLMSTIGAYDATDLLATGFLRFDSTTPRQGVIDVNTLNAWAARDLARAAGAVPFLDFSVQIAGFNQSVLGSVFTAQIDDFTFPKGANGAPGYSARHRCIGYEVHPAERGTVDEIKLIIEQN